MTVKKSVRTIRMKRSSFLVEKISDQKKRKSVLQQSLCKLTLVAT